MYSILVYLLKPYTLACGVTGVAIVSLWRKRQVNKRHLLLLTFGFASMMILSLPAVSYLGLGSLEWSFPPHRYFPADAEAIVVLSGSCEPPDGVRLEATMGSDTLLRCLHAAEVYHRAGAQNRSGQWRKSRSRVSRSFVCPTHGRLAHQVGSGCLGPEDGTQLPINFRERGRMPQTPRSVRHPKDYPGHRGDAHGSCVIMFPQTGHRGCARCLPL